MSFIAAEYFGFDEEGDYIPYNKTYQAPTSFLNTPFMHLVPEHNLVLYPDVLYNLDKHPFLLTRPGDLDYGFNLY
jgi:hypothetical protein